MTVESESRKCALNLKIFSWTESDSDVVFLTFRKKKIRNRAVKIIRIKIKIKIIKTTLSHSTKKIIIYLVIK